MSGLSKSRLPLDQLLDQACRIFPPAWQYPEYTEARIIYQGAAYQTPDFTETQWMMEQPFSVTPDQSGLIQVCYRKEFPPMDEGPFLREERDLLIIAAEMISRTIARLHYEHIAYNNNERLKELSAINQTTTIIAKNASIDETLREIAAILPLSWQYPEYTAARIRFGGKAYESRDFDDTLWMQREHFVTYDSRKGVIEICYLKELPEHDEGPFLEEERNLIRNIANLIAHYLNNYLARAALNSPASPGIDNENSWRRRETLIRNTSPLQRFFNGELLEKYVYFDMMKYKVQEILFVATLYDAFILENEGEVFERFLGSEQQDSLYSLPRITAISYRQQALEMIASVQFDLVILMAGLDRSNVLALSRLIKEKRPDLPVFVLVSHAEDIRFFHDNEVAADTIDCVFAWNGDSQLFFSIVKLYEDSVNAKNDVSLGLVPVVLFVEDSVAFYSRCLSALYGTIFDRVLETVAGFDKNGVERISRLRARPKVLLARNYEEAMTKYHDFKEVIACVVSDGQFERSGALDKEAGLSFLQYVRSQDISVPCLLQSTNGTLKQKALSIGAEFLNKGDKHALPHLKTFVLNSIRTTEFRLPDPNGKTMAIGNTPTEIVAAIKGASEESLLHPASRRNLVRWFSSRGDIGLAKVFSNCDPSAYEDNGRLRTFFVDTIERYYREGKRGKIVDMTESDPFSNKNITTLAGGSLGGKGRGIAFLNTLVNRSDFSVGFPQMEIEIPVTAVIGTDEFDRIISDRHLREIALSDAPFSQIQKAFLDVALSEKVMEGLGAFVDKIRGPVAVRSSSLFEDSFSQPFSGVFHTYMLPNNHPERSRRIDQLARAVKLVYASAYTPEAKAYFAAGKHHIEDERMAAVIQTVAGKRFGDLFFPHLSGIARSYNFYPVSYMKPEEGFAALAFGLGSYIAEGLGGHRFSPRYPQIEFGSTKDLLNGSQRKFFGVDLRKTEPDYLLDGENAACAMADLSEAERQNALRHCASVYDMANDRIVPGLSASGPRILNFADILRFDYIPLAEAIRKLLDAMREAFGYPIEIEFAATLDPGKETLAKLYLLQIKPLGGDALVYEIEHEDQREKDVLGWSKECLGNGRLDDIRDVIIVDFESFDKLKTESMVREIEYLNNKMFQQGTRYMLIGPGRWGTRDKSLGIPVVWSQISMAKVIIEVSDSDFPIEASRGSHFFHNLTSMHIGYFSIGREKETGELFTEKFDRGAEIEKTSYFRHLRFDAPLDIQMDGRKRYGIIHLP